MDFSAIRANRHTTHTDQVMDIEDAAARAISEEWLGKQSTDGSDAREVSMPRDGSQVPLKPIGTPLRIPFGLQLGIPLVLQWGTH